MFAKFGFLVFLMIGFVSGCSSLRVNSDFDSSADFGSYQTYSFISKNPLLVADMAATSPLLEGRLMAATRTELGAKGYRFVDNPENADFVVSFTLGARDKIRVNSYPASYGRGAYYGGWGTPYYNEVDVRNYTEGTLSVDMFDVTKKSPVWHGWAVKSITSQDRANPEPLLKEVISSILAQYPPTASE